MARLAALDDLLPTLAGVLDVRDVFERVSAIARNVIPHDIPSSAGARGRGMAIARKERSVPPAPADITDLRVVERSMIQKALEAARYNKSMAAKSLGLSRKQLYARLRQHGID